MLNVSHLRTSCTALLDQTGLGGLRLRIRNGSMGENFYGRKFLKRKVFPATERPSPRNNLNFVNQKTPGGP